MRLLHDRLGKCQDIGPDISILLDFLTVEVLGVNPQATLPYLPRCEFMSRMGGKCHSHSARNDCYHVPLYLRSVLSVAIRSWECGQKAPVLLFAALQW